MGRHRLVAAKAPEPYSESHRERCAFDLFTLHDEGLMSISVLSRYALSSCVAAIILSGCGGSQSSIGASGVKSQSLPVATPFEHGRDYFRVCGLDSTMEQSTKRECP